MPTKKIGRNKRKGSAGKGGKTREMASRTKTSRSKRKPAVSAKRGRRNGETLTKVFGKAA